MPIDLFPPPPSPSRPETFEAEGDAFLGALPSRVVQMNEAIDVINAGAAQAEAALAAVNAPAWVSGATYSVGQCVYSPITHYSYRRKIAGAGTTDPSSDSTNWQVLNSGISASGTDTLTNKTIAYASNTLTGVQPTLVSGTSIKTVNSTSLLGSGNISVLGTDVGHNAVGSFCFARQYNAPSINAGNTVAGSGLVPCGISQYSTPTISYNGSVLSGTWRVLGFFPSNTGDLAQSATLVQRIA